MNVDLGLEVAVSEFVRVLTPILEEVYAEAPGGDPAKAYGDVVVEAYNLSCGFIDADGRASDDELRSLLHTFAPLLDRSFSQLTPDDARARGLTVTQRKVLAKPSNLFEVLLAVDRHTAGAGRNPTSLATIYYQHAMALGHMTASLDADTTRSELLLAPRRLPRASSSNASTAPPAGTRRWHLARPVAVSPRRPTQDDGASGRRPTRPPPRSPPRVATPYAPSRSCSPSSTRSWALPRSSRR